MGKKLVRRDGEKKIRPYIKTMVKLGASPMSIVFAVGRLVTIDERDYILKYEKSYKLNNPHELTK